MGGTSVPLTVFCQLPHEPECGRSAICPGVGLLPLSHGNVDYLASLDAYAGF